MHTNEEEVGQFIGSRSFCPELAARKNFLTEGMAAGFALHKCDSAYEPSVSAGCHRKNTSQGSVFLPAAGNRWNGELNNVGTNGNYWSSTPNDENNAYNLDFVSGYDYRYYGQSVRPVVRN